jgi:hypothetical protein
MPSVGFETHDPSVRAREESSCLTPRGHGDRPHNTEVFNKWTCRFFCWVGNLGLVTSWVTVSFQPRSCGMESVTLKRLRWLPYKEWRSAFDAEASVVLCGHGYQSVEFVSSVTGSNLEKMCALREVILKNLAPTSQKTRCVSVINSIWLI